MKKIFTKKNRFFMGILIGSTLVSCSSQNVKGSVNESINKNTKYTYTIVDTGQTEFFDNKNIISKPKKGEAFYGQDAQYDMNEASYTDNRDGTITDNVTGLMWQKSYEVLTYEEAVEKLKTFNLGGYTDWRIPTIKEAYSLINFNGVDASNRNMTKVPAGAIPFIDTNYFEFKYGSNGDRIIDTQLMNSTFYKGKALGNDNVIFGVNLADGRIKGYPTIKPRGEKNKFTVRFVRGNTEYGENKFVYNNNGTVSDLATGLMWSKNDSQKGMTWEEALEYAQEMNEKNYLGYSDWRLPNAKELQSIVDYDRSLQSTDSAAIDPIFNITEITDEGGNKNYPFYWSSTTHKNTKDGSWAVYIAFGEALGYFKDPRMSMNNNMRNNNKNSIQTKGELMDVHGAGAQRSDPKTGDVSQYANGHGPQGDVVRIYNYVRLVRNID